MTILLLITTVLLAGSTGYLGYRRVTDCRLKQRAERGWREHQIRRAERHLHDIASNTFSNMMSTARKASGHCEWHR